MILLWLIVEDEADILSLIATMCQVWGHQSITFPNGQKVWDWLDQVEAGNYQGKLPDFALMDIRMPGKYGNLVANRIRTIPILKHIPIALMTAYALTSDDREKIMKTDGVDYIINKPLPDFDELRTVLNQIIAEKNPPISKGMDS
jgi:CheY-like chemotaxis protein